MICEQCGNAFESKRSSAKYCSGKCRKLAFLSVPKTVSVPEISVLEEVSVPLILEDGKLEIGIEPVECDLPDYVPDIIRERYLRDSQWYRDVIDRLVSHTVSELRLMCIWIPCWKYISE